MNYFFLYELNRFKNNPIKAFWSQLLLNQINKPWIVSDLMYMYIHVYSVLINIPTLTYDEEKNQA